MAQWRRAYVLGLKPRNPGFESWLGYRCLVAFSMYYRDGSSGLDAVVLETTQLVAAISSEFEYQLRQMAISQGMVVV